MRGGETKMEKKCLIILLALLVPAVTSNVYTAKAQTHLRIDYLSVIDGQIPALDSQDVWVEIINPDSSGHFYKIRLVFDYTIADENGYVAAGEKDVVYFTIVPFHIGNLTMVATLWEDIYDGGSGIDQKTQNVIVGKSYMQTQLDNLTSTVQSLQAENSRLNDTLTYSLISLVAVIFSVGFVVWWLDRRRLEDAMPNRT